MTVLSVDVRCLLHCLKKLGSGKEELLYATFVQLYRFRGRCNIATLYRREILTESGTNGAATIRRSVHEVDLGKFS